MRVIYGIHSNAIYGGISFAYISVQVVYLGMLIRVANGTEMRTILFAPGSVPAGLTVNTSFYLFTQTF